MLVDLFRVHNILFLFFLRLKLYYDHGEIKRYNGKRRMGDLKAFVDKFAVTSEVRCSKTGSLCSWQFDGCLVKMMAAEL